LVTFARFAEMVTSVSDFGGNVDTSTCALVAPAGTVMLLGTVAIPGWLLDSVTIPPPGGAAALSITVPVDVPPPFTLIGWRVSDANVTGGGFTVSVAVLVAPPPLAEIVTIVAVGTGLVATAKVTVVVPLGTVTALGTLAAAVLPLDSVTTIPPPEAGAFRRMVPVDEPPPTTFDGTRLTEVTEIRGGGASTVQV
jgi:hypothetical protein